MYSCHSSTAAFMNRTPMDDLQKELATAISETAGQLEALSAALFAICESIDPGGPLAALICQRLEQSYAQKLQVSTNPAYIGRFEQTMDLLKEALQSQPND